MDDKFNEEDAKEFLRHIEILKTNASILRQTSVYLAKCADGLDEMAALYSNPILLALPGRNRKNKGIRKSNECLYIFSIK